MLVLMSVSVKAQEWRQVALTSSVTGVQPMTGLVLWPDEARDRNATYGKSIQLEFSYCLPCKVVKGCADDGTIEYDWTWFDNILADVSSRGHQLIARFRYEYPSGTDVDGKKGTTAVPQYIKDRSDYNETYAKNPGGDGPTYYADWSCAELERFTLQFYTDLAARYANDKRLAFVEVGFGHWSEYHIYGTKLQFGRNFPTKAFQKQFFQHLHNVMAGIPWGVSIDAADDEYSPVVDDDALMALDFGLFDDSFMHKDHEIGSNDGYNERNWNAIGKGVRWQTGFCGGEISYYKDSDQKNFLNPQGMYGHTWEEQSAKYHITFMIANDAPGSTYGTASRFKEAGMAAGYSFCVTACRTNDSTTELTVTNTGVAPIYRDAWFAVGDVRSDETLRGLLPGETRTFTVPVPLELDTQSCPVPAMKPHIICDAILPAQQIEYDASTIADGIKNVEAGSSDGYVGKFYDVAGQRVDVGSAFAAGADSGVVIDASSLKKFSRSSMRRR